MELKLGFTVLLLVILCSAASCDFSRPIGGAGAGGHLELGLRYVAYVDSDGRPVISLPEVQDVLRGTNELWATCDVGFGLVDYETLRPGERGLPYSPAEYRDFADIRMTFADRSALLVVATGPFDRSGILGTTAANAWTPFPGTGLDGVVLESPVDRVVNLLAHELGHCLGLPHVSDGGALMNAVSYPGATALSEGECAQARSAAVEAWVGALR